MAENWDKQRQLHRLELTVTIHNHVAIKLYLKAGLIIEGIRKDLFVDNQYLQTIYE